MNLWLLADSNSPDKETQGLVHLALKNPQRYVHDVPALIVGWVPIYSLSFRRNCFDTDSPRKLADCGTCKIVQ